VDRRQSQRFYLEKARLHRDGKCRYLKPAFFSDLPNTGTYSGTYEVAREYRRQQKTKNSESTAFAKFGILVILVERDLVVIFTKIKHDTLLFIAIALSARTETKERKSMCGRKPV
jgi:hypothetical protein